MPAGNSVRTANVLVDVGRDQSRREPDGRGIDGPGRQLSVSFAHEGVPVTSLAGDGGSGGAVRWGLVAVEFSLLVEREPELGVEVLAPVELIPRVGLGRGAVHGEDPLEERTTGRDQVMSTAPGECAVSCYDAVREH